MRALLIANHDDADAGFVGDRFRHHGYSFVECHRERPGEWPPLEGHHLVLQLGSDWSVYWPQVADEVAAEMALVREADRRGVPVFGICFGQQVLAEAFGGSVRRGPQPEIGWMTVDTLAPGVVPVGPWLQWHYDVVELPPGAELLAASPVGPQAWRRRRVFATQFHPEATETVVARWAAGAGGDELRRLGSSPQEVLDETRRLAGDARRRATAMVDWFVGTICDAVHVA